MNEQAHKVSLDSWLTPTDEDSLHHKKALTKIRHSLRQHLSIETVEQVLGYEFFRKDGRIFARHKGTGRAVWVRGIGEATLPLLQEKLQPYQPADTCAK